MNDIDGETQELKMLALVIQLVGLMINAYRNLLFQELECMTRPTLTQGGPEATQSMWARKTASDQDGI